MKLGEVNYPSAKRFRRRTRLEVAVVNAEQLRQSLGSTMQVLAVYSSAHNWQATGETKDVQNEAGLVVGVEKIHAWVGPGEGPQLAGMALKKLLGVKEEKADG